MICILSLRWNHRTDTIGIEQHSPVMYNVYIHLSPWHLSQAVKDDFVHTVHTRGKFNFTSNFVFCIHKMETLLH